MQTHQKRNYLFINNVTGWKIHISIIYSTSIVISVCLGINNIGKVILNNWMHANVTSRMSGTFDNMHYICTGNLCLYQYSSKVLMIMIISGDQKKHIFLSCMVDFGLYKLSLETLCMHPDIQWPQWVPKSSLPSWCIGKLVLLPWRSLSSPGDRSHHRQGAQGTTTQRDTSYPRGPRQHHQPQCSIKTLHNTISQNICHIYDIL